MYGLVNKAVEDLAVASGGQATWDAIRAKAGVVDPTFISMDAYPDEVTVRLVGAASEGFGWTPAQVLEAFGEHWILYTAREGYGPLLQGMGSTLPEFLGNLDAMHSRISLTMPQLRPPSFVCDELQEGALRVHYYSEREGLGPMVVGLLRGLARMFDLVVTVEHVERSGGGADHDVFDVTYALAGVADGHDRLERTGAP